jgi:hypothetical protein
VNETTTTLKNLTPSNWEALSTLGYRIPMWTLKKTVVVFDGPPAKAEKAVQAAMDYVRRTSRHGGRDGLYCSLIAVRKRLRYAEADPVSNAPRLTPRKVDTSGTALVQSQ